MADDKKAIQNTEGERRDCEEVHRRNCLAMVPEERYPVLGGIWISRDSPYPSRDRGFYAISLAGTAVFSPRASPVEEISWAPVRSSISFALFVSLELSE